MKLNHYLARSGISSRRNSAELIKNGRVQVNGEVALQPSRLVGDGDRITVDKKEIILEKLVYVALNKPIGYACTLKDRFAKLKVTDLITQSLGRLYPVGRLDRDTSGLIFLTNDGDFSQRISHPRHEIEKEYLVVVSPAFKPEQIATLRRQSTNQLENARPRPASFHRICGACRGRNPPDVRRMFFARLISRYARYSACVRSDRIDR